MAVPVWLEVETPCCCKLGLRQWAVVVAFSTTSCACRLYCTNISSKRDIEDEDEKGNDDDDDDSGIQDWRGNTLPSRAEELKLRYTAITVAEQLQGSCWVLASRVGHLTRDPRPSCIGSLASNAGIL